MSIIIGPVAAMIRSLFKKPSPRYVVVEDLSGYWHYHLALSTSITRSLCGKATFHISIPLSAWGERGDLRETYCTTCRAIQLTNSKLA